MAAALLAALQFGIPKQKLLVAIDTLPQIKFRQEKVFDDGRLEVYNDSSATSPEATMAAMARFRNADNFLLITGGTDRDLEFSGWARAVNKYVKKDNLQMH